MILSVLIGFQLLYVFFEHFFHNLERFDRLSTVLRFFRGFLIKIMNNINNLSCYTFNDLSDNRDIFIKNPGE
jgi:hypothetical protein